MPVQTISLSPSVTSLDHSDGGSSSARSFNLPRIKIAATAFLRHGYRSPSNHVTESKHHNRLIIACTLPGEVMRKIFTACAQFSIGGSDTWSWVNISYVCSTWRRVALATPDLWRYIDFSHPKWYAITSVRAKASSLHVVTTITESNIRHLHRTLQLAHRIQHIHLVSPVEKIIPLLEILAHPNPSLESLILDVRIPSSYNRYENIYDPPSFPCNGPPLENLKCMVLHRAPFYLLTPRCIFLTSLHLHDLPLTERPTLRYFLFMIEQLAHLRFLTLDRAFPIEFEGIDNRAPETPIYLSQLQCLSLTGSISEVASSLKHLTIPSTARLICTICTLPNVKYNALKLAESLSSHSWPESGHAVLETLVLTGHESGQRYTEGFMPNPDFRQSVRLRAFSGGDEQGGAVIDLIISPEEVDSTDDAVITALDAICSALPLRHIYTLALQDIDIITQKSWTTILRILTSLSVIDIMGRAPSGVAWALLLNAQSIRKPPKGCDDAQRIIVPNLNDVYLHNVDCSSGGFMVASSAAVNSHCDLDDSRFLDVLVAGIVHRRRVGIFLRSLCIARCGFVLKSTVETARKGVSHLVSDFRGMVKDEDVDETFPARYRPEWRLNYPQIRHYHRLRTLTQLDSES